MDENRGRDSNIDTRHTHRRALLLEPKDALNRAMQRSHDECKHDARRMCHEQQRLMMFHLDGSATSCDRLLRVRLRRQITANLRRLFHAKRCDDPGLSSPRSPIASFVEVSHSADRTRAMCSMRCRRVLHHCSLAESVARLLLAFSLLSLLFSQVCAASSNTAAAAHGLSRDAIAAGRGDPGAAGCAAGRSG